jgi:chromosome segregation ATPase
MRDTKFRYIEENNIMENATIEKLSTAVNQLMNAYDKLKSNYEILENENIQLKNNIQELETDKNNLNSHTQEQSSQMNSMLSKIENILTLDNSSKATPSIDFNTEQQIQEDTTTEDTLDNTTVSNPSNNTKIDLGRMESLLKGM